MSVCFIHVISYSLRRLMHHLIIILEIVENLFYFPILHPYIWLWVAHVCISLMIAQNSLSLWFLVWKWQQIIVQFPWTISELFFLAPEIVTSYSVGFSFRQSCRNLHFHMIFNAYIFSHYIQEQDNKQKIILFHKNVRYQCFFKTKYNKTK